MEKKEKEEKVSFCEHCGSKMKKGESFCSKCGKKVGEETSKNNNTKQCKKCKERININAKKCPKCGAKQGMPVWAVILIVLLAFFVLMAIFSDDNELSSEPNNNTNSSETSTNNNKNTTKKEEKQKKEYNKNETVIYKGVKYSVTNVKYSNGSDWDNPADGKEYVIVTIKIENTSDKKISYNVYDWKMRNSQGQEESEAFTTIDNDTNLSSGDLAVGGTKEGTLVFEEPKNDSSLKLLYFYNTLLEDEESFAIIIK